MRTRALFVAAALAFAPSTASAWGARVHRDITRRAIDLLPSEIKPLFVRNRDELVLRSNDPDLWRLVFPDEAPNHQIDFGVEEYGPYPFVALPREYGAAVEKFGAATVRRYGTLPWRVAELFGMLRRAMEGFARAEPYAESNAVLYAAALAHYVEDGHQPLHVSVNYDGQLTGQLGVHGRFETELFDRFGPRLSITPAPAASVAGVRDFAFDAALDAYQLVPRILDADKEAVGSTRQYDDRYFEAFFTKVKPVVDRQLSRSATAVASLLVAAWDQAGRPPLTTAGQRPVRHRRSGADVRRPRAWPAEP
jgi:hypothetical protein